LVSLAAAAHDGESAIAGLFTHFLPKSRQDRSMDLSKIPLFEAMSKRMAWLSERQTVLAENVANADMPGYVARDLKPPDFRSMVSKSVQQVSLLTTQPGHIAVKSETMSTAETTNTTEPSLSGNRVSLEDEMMKVSQTANDFALTSTLYRANIGLIKAVLGRSSS
jgi:flagellar basal-body rod protein FlgB